jgi:hypothetical protein
MVKAVAGLLSAGGVSLKIYLPTWESSTADSWHEVVLLPVQSAL